jgi:hypothetical protein
VLAAGVAAAPWAGVVVVAVFLHRSSRLWLVSGAQVEKGPTPRRLPGGSGSAFFMR